MISDGKWNLVRLCQHFHVVDYMWNVKWMLYSWRNAHKCGLITLNQIPLTWYYKPWSTSPWFILTTRIRTWFYLVKRHPLKQPPAESSTLSGNTIYCSYCRYFVTWWRPATTISTTRNIKKDRVQPTTELTSDDPTLGFRSSYIKLFNLPAVLH